MPEAAGLSDEQMQQIARELCFSETTFVPLPGAGHACRVRIFTHVNDLVVEDGELVVGRYAFGGATVAREKLTTAVKVFAVMPRMFNLEGASAGTGDVVTPALRVSSAVRCTKSLADFEWLGEDRIIGLSGAKTAPDLYLSVGVSGQIQHTVGVSAAKLIAAVNKDKEAPIFALADYGLVGDLYEIVPALTERLKSV